MSFIPTRNEYYSQINVAICVWRAARGHDATMTSSIPFDEIAPGASVRYALVEGVQHFSVRDLIMAVCKKDNNQAAELWRRSDVRTELEPHCASFKFPGRGQTEQPVIQVQGAVKLLATLPGDNAKRAADILSSQLSDGKLKIAEIQAKALEERLKIENDALRKDLELRSIISCALMLERANKVQHEPVKLGKVVSDMGISDLSSTDLQRVGCIASAKFRAAYGVSPPKRAHKDKNGKEMWINEYSEEHIPILQEAIREHMEQARPDIQI